MPQTFFSFAAASAPRPQPPATWKTTCEPWSICFERGLVALRLVVERRVVRVVREHLDPGVRLLRALDVAADVANDRRHVVRANRADDLLAALLLDLEPCEVADEITGFMLGGDDAGGVLRLLLKQCVASSMPAYCSFGNSRRDRVEASKLRKPTREIEVVARPACGSLSGVRSPPSASRRRESGCRARFRWMRPSFASWLNERSWRLPMSVTIAILKPLALLAAAEPPSGRRQRDERRSPRDERRNARRSLVRVTFTRALLRVDRAAPGLD